MPVYTVQSCGVKNVTGKYRHIHVLIWLHRLNGLARQSGQGFGSFGLNSRCTTKSIHAVDVLAAPPTDQLQQCRLRTRSFPPCMRVPDSLSTPTVRDPF